MYTIRVAMRSIRPRLYQKHFRLFQLAFFVLTLVAWARFAQDLGSQQTILQSRHHELSLSQPIRRRTRLSRKHWTSRTLPHFGGQMPFLATLCCRALLALSVLFNCSPVGTECSAEAKRTEATNTSVEMKEARAICAQEVLFCLCNFCVTLHVEAAGSSVGNFASSWVRPPPRECKARSCRLGDALPSKQGLSVNLTPPAGGEWDAEAHSLAERTTLAIWNPNPFVSLATSPFRCSPGSDASQVGNHISARQTSTCGRRHFGAFRVFVAQRTRLPSPRGTCRICLARGS